MCTGNSCRSQMAEGWARHFLGQDFESFSAGSVKHELDKRAVQVMGEAGVDISEQTPKTIDELPDMDFDVVITLCDSAHESCPFFPGQVKRIHQGFDDPPGLVQGTAAEESRLQDYRRVRDEIRDFVLELPYKLRADI